MLAKFFTLFTFLSCVTSVKVLTQKPSEVTKEKGNSVTLDCNIAKDEGYYVSWHKQLPNAAPQFVLRYYHSHSSPDRYGDSFSSDRFTSKAQSNIDYQLIINNVDVRDSAVYYCQTWDSSANAVGQGTKLLVTDSGVSPPVVYILPSSTEDVSSSEVTLVCLINDMSVGFADVRWLVNGNPVTKGVFTGSAEPQSDEKFKLSSYLTIETSEWQKDKDITCEVTAAGSKTTKKIKKSDCSQ
ncbi:immunoglobulin lambda-1 light chain-like isoform X3 [Triplophysa dalaica]|uniref:immunoglobulin lambda-1 light chain-like isoform X3 n=1 Tax=Triplophysa dalaica TaxID=1582913 RepID=UPI0024DF6552|nr:immunoglobulin lambda-1 light chain-like isoform X3 [Triplophysa dalaica]